MPWPLSQDYNEAIQSPAANFADAELQRGEAAANALGLPMPLSGNFADVYEVRGPGGRWAVKCFTREVPGLRERYTEISRHLRQAKLPFTVDFNYLEQGIRVAGRWYPVLKMQWVEGLTFNQFVSQYLDKPAMLEALLHLWPRMAKYLRAADVAHCDLQHGNVLLVPGNNANSLALKLIDYDGMWVPSLAGGKSGEVGHPAYQHPRRVREGTYSREVDRFPLLLIATAIRALIAKGRPLWEKYDNGDNLLFRQQDLEGPSKSALFYELLKLNDPVDRLLVESLIEAARHPLDQTPLLEEATPEASPAPAPPRSQRPGPLPPPAPVAVAPKAPARPPAVAAPRDFAESGHWSPPPPCRQGWARAVRRGKWIAAGVTTLALVLGGAAAVYLATRNAPGVVAVAPTVPQTSPAAEPILRSTPPAQTRPAAIDPDKEVVKPDPKPLDPPEPKPVVKPPDPKPPVPDPKPVVKPPDPKPPVPDPKPVVKPPDPKPPVPDPKPVVKKSESRPAVPEKTALASAEKEAKEVTYKEEYAKNKPEEVLALARRMVKDGLDTKDNPASRYFLLHEAYDVAARLEDLPLAFRAAEELANHFAVDVGALKATALEHAQKNARDVAEHLNVIWFALAAVDDAVEEDAYDVADRLLKTAQTSTAKTVRSRFAVPVPGQIQGRVKEIAALRKAYEPIPDLVRTLAAKPDDPDANLGVGKFYAFTKGDWDRGLGPLSLGSDAKLKALALADLTGPAEEAAAAELGDRYTALAETASGTPKASLLGRACYWYGQAERKLEGPALDKVTKKRVEIEKRLPSRPVVLYARYGAYNGWADVTTALRCKLTQVGGQKLPSTAIDYGVDDPAFGEQKTVVVVYRYRGTVRLGIAGQPNTPAIPAPMGWPDATPGRPAPAQELTVLYARYGNEDKYAEVAAKVQVTVRGATGAANPNQFDLPDPYPGRHKALIVVYRQDGRIRLSITPQEETARLGEVPAEP